jgi:hypothetical protein
MAILQTFSTVLRQSDPSLSSGHFYQVKRFQICLRLGNFMKAYCGISLIHVYGSSYNARKRKFQYVLLPANVFIHLP